MDEINKFEEKNLQEIKNPTVCCQPLLLRFYVYTVRSEKNFDSGFHCLNCLLTTLNLKKELNFKSFISPQQVKVFVCRKFQHLTRTEMQLCGRISDTFQTGRKRLEASLIPGYKKIEKVLQVFISLIAIDLFFFQHSNVLQRAYEE